jgi:hypothetical protein
MARRRPIALDQIAKQIRTLAATIAPYDTGNLSRRIKSYNTLDRMVKWNDKTFDSKITLFFAPPGARYGQFWNKPFGRGSGTTATLKKRYPSNFDYAEKAMNDRGVKKMYKDFAKAIGKEIASDLRKSVRTA